jgi:hypothetical protein
MKCPHCTDVTLVMTERQGVEIDYCPQCRGVWLDRGELDKLIARDAGRAGAGSRSRPTSSPPAVLISRIRTTATTAGMAGANPNHGSAKYSTEPSSPGLLSYPFLFRNTMHTSFRTTAATVIAVTIASMTVPSLAFAKRMGGGGRSMPAARAGNAPGRSGSGQGPGTRTRTTAAPAAAAAPAARGPGLMGTMGAVAVGAVSAPWPAMRWPAAIPSSDKETKAKDAEKEAQELQHKADEAKRKAEAARAAVK